MCNFGFINIPKGVKTGIGLKHIIMIMCIQPISQRFRIHSGTNQSVYQNLYCPQKVGDIWRIKNHVSLEMHVMYESYVVGCCLLCVVVPSLLTYVPTLFHLRQPCSQYSKKGVAGRIQTRYILVYLDPGIDTCSGFTLLVVCNRLTRPGRAG